MFRPKKRRTPPEPGRGVSCVIVSANDTRVMGVGLQESTWREGYRQRIGSRPETHLANPLISLAQNAERPASVSRKFGVPPAHRIRHFGIGVIIIYLRAGLPGRVCFSVPASAAVSGVSPPNRKRELSRKLRNDFLPAPKVVYVPAVGLNGFPGVMPTIRGSSARIL